MQCPLEIKELPENIDVSVSFKYKRRILNNKCVENCFYIHCSETSNLNSTEETLNIICLCIIFISSLNTYHNYHPTVFTCLNCLSEKNEHFSPIKNLTNKKIQNMLSNLR